MNRQARRYSIWLGLIVHLVVICQPSYGALLCRAAVAGSKVTRDVSVSALWRLLDAPKKNGAKIIELLSEAPSLKALFESAAQVKEGYSIEQHTEMVFDVFDQQFPLYQKYYGLGDLPGVRLLPTLKLMLALHDIGKPYAIQAGDKTRQHEFTIPILKQVFTQFGFSENEIRLAIALIDNDVMGGLLQNKMSVDQALGELKKTAALAGLSTREFAPLLFLFYAVDAGSYQALREKVFTRDGGRLVPDRGEYRRLSVEAGVMTTDQSDAAVLEEMRAASVAFAEKALARYDKQLVSRQDMAWGALIPDRPLSLRGRSDDTAAYYGILNRLSRAKNSGRLDTLAKTQVVLQEIDPKAAALTSQIVREENISIVMRRRQDPVEILKFHGGDFLNIFDYKKSIAHLSDDTIVGETRQKRFPHKMIWAARALVGTSELAAIKAGQRAFPFESFMPKHASLTFKTLPAGISMARPYENQPVNELFGFHGYAFEYAKIKKRSLLVPGDFMQVITANVASETRDEVFPTRGQRRPLKMDVPHGTYEPDGFALRESLVKDLAPLSSMASLANLNMVYVRTFLYLAAGQKILFNDLDGLEVVIFGPLGISDAEAYGDSFNPANFTQKDLDALLLEYPQLRHLKLLH